MQLLDYLGCVLQQLAAAAQLKVASNGGALDSNHDHKVAMAKVQALSGQFTSFVTVISNASEACAKRALAELTQQQLQLQLPQALAASAAAANGESSAAAAAALAAAAAAGVPGVAAGAAAAAAPDAAALAAAAAAAGGLGGVLQAAAAGRPQPSLDQLQQMAAYVAAGNVTQSQLAAAAAAAAQVGAVNSAPLLDRAAAAAMPAELAPAAAAAVPGVLPVVRAPQAAAAAGMDAAEAAAMPAGSGPNEHEDEEGEEVALNCSHLGPTGLQPHPAALLGPAGFHGVEDAALRAALGRAVGPAASSKASGPKGSSWINPAAVAARAHKARQHNGSGRRQQQGDEEEDEVQQQHGGAADVCMSEAGAADRDARHAAVMLTAQIAAAGAAATAVSAADAGAADGDLPDLTEKCSSEEVAAFLNSLKSGGANSTPTSPNNIGSKRQVANSRAVRGSAPSSKRKLGLGDDGDYEPARGN
jgi:hypothetical protein